MDNKYYNDIFFGQISINRKGINPPEGIISGLELQKLFLKYLSSISLIKDFNDFNNLNYDLRIVTVDLITGDGYVWTKGDLGLAARTSMNVPGVFPPVKVKNKSFVDGGIYKNLPVNELKEMNIDYTLGVDISTKPSKKINNIMDTFSQIISLFIREKTKKSYNNADMIFSIPLKDFSSSDFNKYKDIYKVGYEYGKKKVRYLKKTLRKKRKKYKIKNIVINDNIYKLNKKLSEDEIYDFINNKIDYNKVVEYSASFKNKSIYVENIKYIKKIIIYSPEKDIFYENNSLTNTSKLLKIVKQNEKEKGFLNSFIYKTEFENKILKIYTKNLKIDNIKIKGNEEISNSFIKDFFDKPIYFNNSFYKSLNRLYGTGYFKTILPYFKKENNKNILILNIKEKDNIIFNFTAHYDSNKGLMAYHKLDIKNLMGWNEKVSLEYKVKEDHNVKLNFNFPVLMGKPLEFNTGMEYKEFSYFPKVSYKEKKFNYYTNLNLSGYISGLTVGLYYNEYNSFYEEYLKYSYIKTNFLYDSLNNKNLKTKGINIDLNVKYPINNYSFYKIYLNGEFYLKPSKKFVLYQKAFIGKLKGNSYPYNEKMYYNNVFDDKYYSHYDNIYDFRTGLKCRLIKKYFTPYFAVGAFSDEFKFRDIRSYYVLGIEREIPLVKYLDINYKFAENHGKLYVLLGSRF